MGLRLSPVNNAVVYDTRMSLTDACVTAAESPQIVSHSVQLYLRSVLLDLRDVEESMALSCLTYETIRDQSQKFGGA